MTQLETARVRYLPARSVPIVKATDLGSVQVLKHGNRFLLTDSFGDIHPDSRGLGLDDGDTRVLACSVLRIGGIRPVDVGSVLSQGGAGVAVVSGILGAGDIETAAREYRARFSV